jgi:hypothetical protein
VQIKLVDHHHGGMFRKNLVLVGSKPTTDVGQTNTTGSLIIIMLRAKSNFTPHFHSHIPIPRILENDNDNKTALVLWHAFVTQQVYL